MVHSKNLISHSSCYELSTINYELSFQFSLSALLYFQGAPLFSTLPNIVFRLAGACDSSITIYWRISIIISSGLMFTGQASVQALQVVQAQSSSRSEEHTSEL